MTTLGHGSSYGRMIRDGISSIPLPPRPNAKSRIDLPSLLRGAAEHARVERRASGHWQLSGTSKSGNSKIIALFENSDGFPIRSVDVRMTKDGSRVLSIREIATNQKGTAGWPKFPVTEAIRSGLRVVRVSDTNLERPPEGHKAVASGIRAWAAQGALRNPKWRTMPYLDNVDWEAVTQANTDVGLKLRALLRTDSGEPPQELPRE